MNFEYSASISIIKFRESPLDIVLVSVYSSLVNLLFHEIGKCVALC